MTNHIEYKEHLEYELNPFFVWRVQYENALGKKAVGITANGLKVASTL